MVMLRFSHSGANAPRQLLPVRPNPREPRTVRTSETYDAASPSTVEMSKLPVVLRTSGAAETCDGFPSQLTTVGSSGETRDTYAKGGRCHSA